MVITPIRYPLDPTGTNANNLVQGEIHTLPNRTVRAVAPLYGAFFAESLVITDLANNQVLTSGQYVATEMYEFPTGRYGKEIDGIILIKDTSVSNNISLTYQALGGEYGYNVEAIISLLNSLELDNRPVRWPDIINKPAAFVPASHFHDIGDVYGFEYVVHAIERLRQAILIGDAASHDEILRYIDATAAALENRIAIVESGLAAHKADFNNPHNTTKTQVGLGSVENYPVATEQEARDGLVTNKYMTPLRVAQAVDTQAGALVRAHVQDQNNPHNTTKAQVGLGLVQNYDVATEQEAREGTVTNKYMTPLRVSQAINTQAGALLAAHVNDFNNPHQTTKAQVGLGSVDNYATATQAEAEAGQLNTRFMTPLRVAQEVQVLAVTPLNNHIQNQSNPHNTTKAQVGLGNVSNYLTANDSEATAATATDRFMSANGTRLAIMNYGAQLVNAHAGRTDNPHSTTKAQVGLSEVQNYGIASEQMMIDAANNTSYVTPYLVGRALVYYAINPLNNHVGNQSNPHNTTKGQVGLGNVDNFPTATPAEAVAGARNDAFVTPYGMKQAIDASKASTTIQVVNSDWGYHYDPATGYLKCWGRSPSLYDNNAVFFWFRKGFSKLRSLQVTHYSVAEAGNHSQTRIYEMAELTFACLSLTVGVRGFGGIPYRDVGGQNADSCYITYMAEGFTDPLSFTDGPQSYAVMSTSNLAAASGTDNIGNGGMEGPWTGTYPRNFNSGGSSGGGGAGGSVAITAFMPNSDKRAGEMVPGDDLVLLNESLDGVKPGKVITNRISGQFLLKLVSESGIKLTCSDNTPLTLEDGSEINSTEALGVKLPVQDDKGFRWEEIVAVEKVGYGNVATIFCEDQCYAAGDEPGRYIWTHNATGNAKT